MARTDKWDISCGDFREWGGKLEAGGSEELWRKAGRKRSTSSKTTRHGND
jgi:hypothetical protein